MLSDRLILALILALIIYTPLSNPGAPVRLSIALGAWRLTNDQTGLQDKGKTFATPTKLTSLVG
jgi:hypothetical protein